MQEAKGEMNGDEDLRFELGLASAGLAAVSSFDMIDVILIPFFFLSLFAYPSYIGFLSTFSLLASNILYGMLALHVNKVTYRGIHPRNKLILSYSHRVIQFQNFDITLPNA